MIAGASTSTVVDIPPRQEFALPAPHVLVSEADGVAAGLYHHPAPLQQQQQQQSLCISQRLLQQSPPRDGEYFNPGGFDAALFLEKNEEHQTFNRVQLCSLYEFMMVFDDPDERAWCALFGTFLPRRFSIRNLYHDFAIT